VEIWHIFVVQKNPFKKRKLIVILALIIIAGLSIAFIGEDIIINQPKDALGVFFGLDIGYGDEQTAIGLIEKVDSYVNLIILGSLNVTTDTEKLTRLCDLIYRKDLHFLIYVAFGEGDESSPPRGPDSQFFVMASDRWGSRFLGVYLFDEVGGKLMDGAHSIDVTAAKTHSEAAILFTHHLNYYLGNISKYYEPAQFPLVTSDYALYWFNYLAGYDVVFTEYVENQSRQIATGLCRGAAKSQNKEWGVIITWSEDLESFVLNPEQMYSDLILAYQNGAKYIVVFNSPGKFPAPTEYGTLTSEHFDKMKNFWNYINTQSPVENYPANTAFVIPKDYGYGFRGPDDKIWGKWEADSFSSQIWNDIKSLLESNIQYLDIVYETKIDNETINLPYAELIYWNGTIIQK
jgi:hypothetical protein